jgi:hypothetical protein
MSKRKNRKGQKAAAGNFGTRQSAAAAPHGFPKFERVYRTTGKNVDFVIHRYSQNVPVCNGTGNYELVASQSVVFEKNISLFISPKQYEETVQTLRSGKETKVLSLFNQLLTDVSIGKRLQFSLGKHMSPRFYTYNANSSYQGQYPKLRMNKELVGKAVGLNFDKDNPNKVNFVFKLLSEKTSLFKERSGYRYHATEQYTLNVHIKRQIVNNGSVASLQENLKECIKDFVETFCPFQGILRPLTATDIEFRETKFFACTGQHYMYCY